MAFVTVWVYDAAVPHILFGEWGYNDTNPQPDNTTTQPPPTPGQYQIPAFDTTENAWVLIPDYRGVPLYTVDGFAAPEIQNPGETPDPSLLFSPNLAWYQRQQIAVMIAASDAAINSDVGFSSSATGTTYTYGTSEAFREELEAAQAQAALHNGESSWSITLTALDSAKWPAVVTHTAAQVLSVAADQATAIATSRVQLAARIASIRAIADDSATGYAAVQAITWATS